MDSDFDLLLENSKQLKKDVENIPIGAKIHYNHVPLEEKILRLKDLNNFLKSKKQLLDIDSLKEESVSLTEEEIEQLINKQIESELHSKLFHLMYMNREANELFEINNSEVPEITRFKKSLLQQLNYMKILDEALQKLITKQRNILEESTDLKTELKNAQIEYKKQLTERKQKYQEKVDKKLGNDYNDMLQGVQERIKKLNFMRILTVRLLVHDSSSWENKKEFINILEKMRYPFTLESFIR